MNAPRDPLISVIIPVYNDPEGIQSTLKSVVNTSYPVEKYEVLVVDNGSTDTTRDVIMNYRDHHQNIKLLEERDIQSSYAARNQGVNHAKGDFLAFVDADVTVRESWLDDIENEIKVTNASYLGCDVVVTTQEYSLIAEYNQLTGFPVKRYLENEHFAPTCGLVVKYEVIREVGDFDERLISGGDMEFGQRVFESGFGQQFTDQIKVYHPARSSLRQVISKMIRVGRGLAQYSIYHPERFDKYIWLQLGGYLPPHPIRFHHRMRYEHGVNPLQKIISFYFLVYLIRLSRTSGAVYQLILYRIYDFLVSLSGKDGKFS